MSSISLNHSIPNRSEVLNPQENKRAQNVNEASQQILQNRGRVLSLNSALAGMSGFVSKALLEKAFFQNSQISPMILLNLSNDLIKLLSSENKQMFSMTKEVTLFWKQWRGVSLDRDERAYLESPASIDVSQEILNGVRLSSAYLLGNTFYHSVSSAMTERLWTHLPAICGYFGVSVMGPKALSSTITWLLSNQQMEDEQRSLVEPWLNAVGQLALGFTPKVYATSQGVHYQYPSLEGYHQTISQYQTSTLEGNALNIEMEGHVETSIGNYSGTYEAEFNLGQVNELSEERIRIELVNGQGDTIPVLFTKVQGDYGPRVVVSCEDKELESQWSNYFHGQGGKPTSHLNTKSIAINDELSPREKLSSIIPVTGPNSSDISGQSHMVSTLCFIGGLIALGNPNPLSSVAISVALLTVLSPKPVMGFLGKVFEGVGGFIGDIFYPKNSVEDSIEKAGEEARAVIEFAGKKFEETLVRVKDQANSFVMDLGKEGKVLIKATGNEVRVTADKIAENTQATLNVAGHEIRFTTETVGKEARATVTCIGEEARLTIRTASGEAKDLVGTIERSFNQAILNFGNESRLTLNSAGEEIRLSASETLKHLFKGSEATLNVAGHEVRLTAQEIGRELRMTISAAGDEAVYVVDSSGKIVTRTVRDIEQSVKVTIDHAQKQAAITFGEARHIYQEMLDSTNRGIYYSSSAFFSGIMDWSREYFWPTEFHKLEKEIRLAVEASRLNQKEDEKSIVGRFLPQLHDQSQLSLSPYEKARLYAKLINVISSLNVSTNDKKWFSFVIAGLAYQENLAETSSYFGLYSTTTNYFEEVVIPTLTVELRTAFATNNFDSIHRDCNRYLEEELKTFFPLASEKEWESVKKVCLLGADGLEDTPIDDVPVGTVIAYASGVKIPEGYLICDGSCYPKERYPELQSALPGSCKGSEKDFQVPDYRNVFLRGVSDLSAIGTFQGDTTKMPDQPFKVKEDGLHDHKMSLAGKHEHTLGVAGKHSHKLEEGGLHSHKVSNHKGHIHQMDEKGGHSHHVHPNGEHAHPIHDAGLHSHGMDHNGKHNHNNGPFKYLSRTTGEHTTNGHHDHTNGEPDLIYIKKMADAGDHKHHIHNAGLHSHGMGKQGSHAHKLNPEPPHKHEIHLNGKHNHELESGGLHTHTVLNEGAHAHSVSTEEDHLHKILEKGAHTHPLVGGDEETRPKNIGVVYLIKAEPVRAFASQIKGLREQIYQLKSDLDRKDSSRDFSTLGTMIASVLFGFVLRRRG